MPRLEAIQGARPTGSRNVWRQAIGRGARPCQEINKTHFLRVDHCGWTKYHGYFTDPDVVDLCRGLSKERPTTMTTCRACGAQLASRPRVCAPRAACPWSVASRRTRSAWETLQFNYQRTRHFSAAFRRVHIYQGQRRSTCRRGLPKIGSSEDVGDYDRYNQERGIRAKKEKTNERTHRHHRHPP